MTNALKFTAILALLSLTACVVVGTEALWRVADQTIQSEAEIAKTAAAVPAKLDAASATLDRQLHAFNVSVATFSTATARNEDRLLGQTQDISQDLNRTLAGLQQTNLAASELLQSTNASVTNSDLPALVRDTRLTVSLAGTTLAHVRSTANTIAAAAPAITASIQTTSASANAIAADFKVVAADVHQVADDFVKPKPWWKKLLSGIAQGCGLLAVAKSF